jgi:hypothetical protein
MKHLVAMMSMKDRTPEQLAEDMFKAHQKFLKMYGEELKKRGVNPKTVKPLRPHLRVRVRNLWESLLKK